MIQREKYIEKLKALRGQHIIKVITGIRRSGKSTLMQLFQTYLLNDGISKEDIVSMNFEERENASFNDWKDVYDNIIERITTNGTHYVFLDEVQILPNFERLIDALYVRADIDLYVTGSNAYLLSSEIGTLLSGRYIAINMRPFSFCEYVEAFGGDNNADRLFRQYMNNSSFPEAVNLWKSAPELSNDYLRALYETVVVKDIVKRHHLRKFDTLQRIVNFLFDNIGSVVSPNNIADTISRLTGENLSHNTVQKYISFFTESYLIYPVKLYNIKGKRLLNANYKYYVVDLGFRNILQTNNPDMDLGHKLENVVYFELLSRGGEVFAGRMEDKEVDFIVQKYNGQREYYQVSYTVNDEKTLKREISSLIRIRDAYPKYLLTFDYDETNIDGIQKMNVVDWLLRK
ncbi:MAG: ATP-binding protein [Prevotella sp.]|nr:ATP-binding protein [Prevotella sp.]